MVNATMMLLVIMLWTVSLTLASPRHQSVCDKYELPENAVWIPRANCEDNREFQCQPGYQSQVQTTCNKNGKWDLEPSCQAKDCGTVPLGILSTGTAANGTTYPNIADYTCNEGHEVTSGESSIECLASGQWDVDNVLVCQAKECSFDICVLYDNSVSIGVDDIAKMSAEAGNFASSGPYTTSTRHRYSAAFPGTGFSTAQTLLNSFRPEVPNVIIFMTPGVSGGNHQTTVTSIKNTGTIILTIGIGSGVDIEELKDIASNPSQATFVNSFDDIKESLFVDLVNDLC